MLLNGIQAARELAHEHKMSRLIPSEGAGKKAEYEPPADLPEWMRQECLKTYHAADLPPAKPRKDDGLGRKVSITDVRPGDRLYCPKGMKRFGYSGRDSVSPGSECVVTEVKRTFLGTELWVEFTDAETGEVIRGDIETFELRWPVAQSVAGDGENMAPTHDADGFLIETDGGEAA